MEITGKVIVIAIIWLFRFFGMPQLYNAYYSNRENSKLVFCIILFIAAVISIMRIYRQVQKHKEKEKEDYDL